MYIKLREVNMMKAFLEVVKFNAEDVITTSAAACKIPGNLTDECDPDAE